MKNVTLSIPDDLLKQSREYAKKHGTTLNTFIRQLLCKTVNSESKDAIDLFLSQCNELAPSKKWNWNRNEIYNRKGLS